MLEDVVVDIALKRLLEHREILGAEEGTTGVRRYALDDVDVVHRSRAIGAITDDNRLDIVLFEGLDKATNITHGLLAVANDGAFGVADDDDIFLRYVLQIRQDVDGDVERRKEVWL